MEVLRDNRDSLMAVLEAFVYEPLLAWRLTATNQPGGRVTDAQDMDDAGAYVKQRKSKANETAILIGAPRTSSSKLRADYEADAERSEVKNDKALQVIERVRRKLTGRDFKPEISLDVKAQVEKLVDEATKTENLCVAFLGWYVTHRIVTGIIMVGMGEQVFVLVKPFLHVLGHSALEYPAICHHPGKHAISH